MKKVKYIICIVFVCMLLASMLTGCNIGKISSEELDLSNMELVFQDEFNGSKVNETVWNTTVESEIRRGGYWSADQTFVEDGNLIIQTEYKEDGEYGAGWYTGTCRSKDKKDFTYGYFEVRCKAPAAEGIWSAFWLLAYGMGKDGKVLNGKDGAEIDIMESPFYNDPQMPVEKYRNTTMHTLHVNGYGENHKSRMSKYYVVDKDMYNEYNTYGVLWTKDSYTFYINGHKTWKTSFGVSQAPEYLWLSVEIAGEQGSANPANPKNKYCWSGEVTNNKGEARTSRFVVDYVRVYQDKK